MADSDLQTEHQRVAEPERRPSPAGGRSGGETPAEAAAPDGSGSAGRAPGWARAFVAAYLAAFALCGILVIEAWPLTSWRLFSHLRTPRVLGWQATTVSSTGREAPIRFGGLPAPYRHLPLIMRDYATKPPAQQDAICRAWAQAARRRGRDVAGVRIYRTTIDLRRHRGRRDPPPPRRRLRFTCADGRGARAVA